jgi:glycerol-3-phosphate acyltransferase PlsY
MITTANILALIAAYLIGSIPSSVWIGQLFYGVDVREYGSGNAGATNTLRVLGKKAGIPVLIIDILKGALAVNLPYFFAEYAPESTQFLNMQLVLGLAGLLGHVFPIYVGFRGGKGIATLLGIVVATDPVAALFALGVFVLVLFISRYVSLSSIMASFAFPAYVIFIEEHAKNSLVIFSLFIMVLVLITHQKNIERLIRREESKVFSKRNMLEEDDDDDDE